MTLSFLKNVCQDFVSENFKRLNEIVVHKDINFQGRLRFDCKKNIHRGFQILWNREF